MCRCLYHVRGAVTTRCPVEWCPIFSASNHYHFDVVKWLYQNGAKSEVLEVMEETSAISTCFYATNQFPLRKGAVDFAKWLILEGVLEEGSAKPDARRLHHFLYEVQYQNELWELEDMPRLFIGWMGDLLQPNILFHNCLLGTLPDPQYSDGAMKKMLGTRIGSVGASMLVDEAVTKGKSRDIWDSLLTDIGRTASANACLASFDGVLEKIGDYVGIIKNKTKLKRIADSKAIAKSGILKSCVGRQDVNLERFQSTIISKAIPLIPYKCNIWRTLLRNKYSR